MTDVDVLLKIVTSLDHLTIAVGLNGFAIVIALIVIAGSRRR